MTPKLMHPKFAQQKAAAAYHRDYTGVNVAKGLEVSQKARVGMFSAREYEEIEAVSILAVYMVHLSVTGMMDDPQLQARLIERARKMAEEKLHAPLEVEVIPFAEDHVVRQG